MTTTMTMTTATTEAEAKAVLCDMLLERGAPDRLAGRLADWQLEGYILQHVDDARVVALARSLGYSRSIDLEIAKRDRRSLANAGYAFAAAGRAAAIASGVASWPIMAEALSEGCATPTEARDRLTELAKLPTHLIVTSACACMPKSCWGTYRRVAVLEVLDDGTGSPIEPAMISDHARGVVQVVETWECLNVGTTERCAYSRAWAEAEALVEELTEARS